MFNLRSLKLLVLFAALFAVVVGQAVLAQPDTGSDRFGVEVAEDGNRFVFTTERLHDDGMPAYGTPFVTQGYIYPVGTLNGSNGVLPNGEPEFPEHVIGTWTCYGWMIGDGAHTTTGAWVISTQVFQFANSGATIITDGFEIADLNEPVARAVTGGTDIYTAASGEQVQELLGFTEQMGVNLRVQFQLSQRG